MARVSVGWLASAAVASMQIGCSRPEPAIAVENPAANAVAMSASAALVEESPPIALAEPAAPTYWLQLGPSTAGKAENGRGETVPAVDPRVLDVHGPAWPGRALDPVLHVGDLHFHHYEHASKQILRWTVSDAALVSESADAYVQWGDDERSRIPLARTGTVAP